MSRDTTREVGTPKMRLYSFDDLRVGVGTRADRLVDVTNLLAAHVPPTERMPALIADWANLQRPIAKARMSGETIRLSEVTLLAPVPAPKVVMAAPVNYRRHQDEMGGETGVYKGEEIKSIGTYAGFVKASSSVIGPDQQIRLPPTERRFDHEAEVGVVIGAAASGVPRNRALGHVFGYLPLLDITMRGHEDRSFRKSFDTFTPTGPAIVTADEIPDPGDISFELTVNGEVRQVANTRDLIYDIPRLIELYSGALTLQPGDLIATGTPEGVGEIRSGDEVVLTVHGIGSLRMSVTALTRVPA